MRLPSPHWNWEAGSAGPPLMFALHRAGFWVPGEEGAGLLSNKSLSPPQKDTFQRDEKVLPRTHFLRGILKEEEEARLFLRVDPPATGFELQGPTSRQSFCVQCSRVAGFSLPPDFLNDLFSSFMVRM